MQRKKKERKKSSNLKLFKNSLSLEELTEVVQIVAHELYEKKGRIPGNELGDWLDAEREVKKVITTSYFAK